MLDSATPVLQAGQGGGATRPGGSDAAHLGERNVAMSEALTERPEAGPDRGPPGDGFDRGYPGERFEPTRLLTIFLSRWRLFAAIALGCFLAAAIFTFLTPRKYTATSTVVLEAPASSTQGAPTPVDSATVDTEVEVVRSRALAQKVAEAVSGGRPIDAVLPQVEGGLKVSRAGLTSAINISFTASDPARAREIANVYAQQYLRAQQEAKAQTGAQSGQFLNKRLEALKADVEKANQAIAEYKAANGLLANPGATYTAGEVSSYNQQLATARASLAEDEARLRLARAQLGRAGSGSSTESFDSQLLRDLRGKRAEVSGRVAQLQDRYGAQHPDLLKAQSALADIDGQIDAELRRVIAGLEGKAQVARQRVASLQGSLGAARGTLANDGTASLQLAELERAAEAARTVYTDFLNRSKQTSAAMGGEQPDAKIVSLARLPGSPSSPNVPVNLALGLLFGIGAGAAGVLLAERLQSSLTTGRDVENHLGLPFLGALPSLGSVAEAAHKHLSPVDYVVEKPLSSYSEAIRSLRTALRTVRDGRPAKVVVFTSALPSEGKTTTAVCVARSAAQGGGKVLIIDCDLRRRNVNNLLRLQPERGLLEVLVGRATVDEVIVRDEATGLDVLPLSRSTFTPEDVFDTAGMNQIIRDAAAKYDLVIMDTAPTLAVSDTRVLAAKADTVVFLTKWRQTPIQAADSALKLLETSGAHIGGVVLSQVDMKRQVRYGYGDQTYYYAKYRKYYQDQ